MQFYALEHFPTSDRGGNIDPQLFRLETKCIVTLQATQSPVLMECISYKPFL